MSAKTTPTLGTSSQKRKGPPAENFGSTDGTQDGASDADAQKWSDVEEASAIRLLLVTTDEMTPKSLHEAWKNLTTAECQVGEPFALLVPHLVPDFGKKLMEASVHARACSRV